MRGAGAALLLLLAVAAAALCGTAEAAVRTFQWHVAEARAAPDCVERRVAAINGLSPGPPIYADMGDRIKVRVCNNLTEGLSMHWHGLHMKGQQWMDGAAYGTQCPIKPGQCFTYSFRVRKQHGTFWYHAHIALLRASVYGALVIRPGRAAALPFPKPKGDYYLLLNDWYHRYPDDLIAGLEGQRWTPLGLPDSYLINGRGRVQCDNYISPYPTNSTKYGKCVQTSSLCSPLSSFSVKKGRTYRLRLINVGLDSRMNFAIQNHTLKIVMADGSYIKPVVVDSIILHPGQAFDVILTANQPPSAYWISVNGYASAPGLAVLKYEEGKQSEPSDTSSAPRSVSTEDSAKGQAQQLQLRDLAGFRGLKRRKVNRYFSLQWNLVLVNGSMRYAVNNRSFVSPSSPLLLDAYAGKASTFNKQTELPANFPELANPPNGLSAANSGVGIWTVKKGEFVQIVFQNYILAGGPHPFHLHGFNFYVVGYGSGVYNRSQEATYAKSYNLVDPPLLSTVAIYDSAWVAVRFAADNVGVWNLHCHLEAHMHLGMQLFLRVVGAKGDIPPPPKGLPTKCGGASRNGTGTQ